MNKVLNSVFSYLQGDKMIWLVVFLLFMFSLLAVYSSTGTLAYKERNGDTEFYLYKQLALSFLGLLLMWGMHMIDYKYYSRPAQILWYLSLFLLFYTLFFGAGINHAKRWIKLPLVGLTLETSDFARLALIAFLARQLSINQDKIADFKQSFLPILFPVVLTALLIAPANLSTALILFFTCVLIMFIGRINFAHILFLFGVSLVSLALFILLLFALPDSLLRGRMPTWKHRIENFRTGTQEGDDSYQVLQSKIAIAKGHIVRFAPGNSTQKNFLPEPFSDFIYAIIIEEYGLLGGVFLVLLYLIFLYRCIRIVIHAPKAFGALLAAGLGISLVIQALMNMAVAVNLVPVTGVALPLVSMGGSSVIFTSVSFGIILSVSRNVELENGKENLPTA